MEANNALTVSEIANIPREVQIGGHKLEIRQLSIKEIFGFFEQKIKDVKIKEAQEMSLIMDASTRKEFLIDVWKNLPSGTELTDKVTDLMASIDGVYDILYLASKDYSDITLEGIKDSIDFKNIGELTPVINWIAGMEDVGSDDGGEKKTEK